MPAAQGSKRELEVQALWHEQVHVSKVATLAFSAGSDALWSGCDAAAPRADAEGDSNDPPVALVSCKDGSTLRRTSGMPSCNVRLLCPLPQIRALLCVTGDGGCMALSTVGEQEDAPPSVCSSAALPGTPAAAALAAATAAEKPGVAEAAGSNGTEQQPATAASSAAAVEAKQAAAAQPGLQQANEQEAAGQGSGVEGPEFMAESGYRGLKQGYLFREGSLGSGYYRKDVVRRYCATVLQPSSNGAAATAAAAAPAVSPLGAGRGAAAGGEQQQPEGKQQAGPRQQSLEGEQVRRYIQRLLAAPPSMHSVVLSPCGSLLFTSSLGPKDCAIRVWRLLPDGRSITANVSDGSTRSGSSTLGGSTALQSELYRTLTGHTAPVLSLALTPDGSLLLSGSHDQTIRVWRTADWHCLRVLKGHGGGVRALAVAPDAGTLYSAAADNTIRAWSMQHWVCLRTLHGRHDDTTWTACMALSPDGSLLASGSTGPFGASTIKVFQTGSGGGREAGACLVSFAQLRYDQKAGMSALLFSPDGGTLYSGASDGTLAAWQLHWREVAQGSGAPGGGLRRGFL
ncbi:hypothetical protein ABPG75_008027 [Micractinium tetrahymenae]